MKELKIAKLGEHRGSPRLWLQGSTVARAGFAPGTRFEIEAHPKRPLLTLKKAEGGMRIVSQQVRGAKTIPVIDINSKDVLAAFSALSSVRVVVENDMIHILPVASELRARQRLQRLAEHLQDGEPISIGSTSSGIGVLDLAAHEGLAAEGLPSQLRLANEIREDCMEHARDKNPAYTDQTLLVTAPMQELAFDRWAMDKLPEVDLFVAGIPCSGASVAGRTKRGLEHPESHPDVGHLVVAFLALVARTNPAVVVLENVPLYRSTASMAILRNQLRDLGYEVHETELDAADWSMLEHRRRMCMVAVTKGMAFSFDDLQIPARVERHFGEVMDQVADDASTWGNIDYLFAKRERDKAAGKGFKPNVIGPDSNKVPTLNKTLHKRQSTGTFIQHPSDDTLYRIPTVREHARCKGIPEVLVEDTTQTFGHEVCGQAISVPPFVSVFRLIARAIKAFGQGDVAQTSFFRLGVAA